MTPNKRDRQQPTPKLWTPLPEAQQEMLSGGSPRVPTPRPPGTGGTSTTGSMPPPPPGV